jgi:protein-tyrosine phosphatase
MAAVLLKSRLLGDMTRQHWDVWSAGIWVAEGRPASAYAIEEMAALGLDLTAHRSQPVTLQLVTTSDLILGVAQEHVETVAAGFPRYASKIRLLSTMASKRYDISDPYGGTRAEYASVAAELESLIAAGYQRIVSLAEEGASSRIAGRA